MENTHSFLSHFNGTLTEQAQKYLAEVIHCGFEFDENTQTAHFDCREADLLTDIPSKSLGGVKACFKKKCKDGLNYDNRTKTFSIAESLIEEAFSFSSSVIDYDKRPVENVPNEIFTAMGYEFATDEEMEEVE